MAREGGQTSRAEIDLGKDGYRRKKVTKEGRKEGRREVK
jgi:hypothetical protein